MAYRVPHVHTLVGRQRGERVCSIFTGHQQRSSNDSSHTAMATVVESSVAGSPGAQLQKVYLHQSISCTTSGFQQDRATQRLD